MNERPIPGDRVRLADRVVQRMGEFASKGRGSWTVIACDCWVCCKRVSGEYVAVDEMGEDGRHRHFAPVFLERA